VRRGELLPPELLTSRPDVAIVPTQAALDIISSETDMHHSSECVAAYYRDDVAESECSLSFSASTHTEVRGRLTAHDVATQTESGHQALPPIRQVEGHTGTTHCRGVQTEKPVGISKPPKLHTFKLSRKCFQTNFKETKQDTIERMILNVMRRLNPRAKGCCFNHIALLTLHNVISEMSARGCIKTSKPHCAWQCLECCTVHGDDLGDDDDVDCPVCGAGAVYQEDEGLSMASYKFSSESTLVDDERSDSSGSK